LPQDHFAKVLLAAIDEGLSSLGDSPRQAILYHLEASFQLKKNDIPKNLTGFKQALERIFGAGAPYIEKIIAQSFYAKLGLDFQEVQDTDLVLSVSDAKRRIVHAGEVKIDE
jgi:hypothetical protein